MLLLGKKKLFKNRGPQNTPPSNLQSRALGGTPSERLQTVFTPYDYNLLYNLQSMWEKKKSSIDFSKHRMVHGAGNHNIMKEKMSLRG